MHLLADRVYHQQCFEPGAALRHYQIDAFHMAISRAVCPSVLVSDGHRACLPLACLPGRQMDDPESMGPGSLHSYLMGM